MNMIKNTISNVEVQKRNKNRVNVYVNGDFLFACSTELVYTQGLKAGKEIDVEKLNQIIEEDNYIKCKNDALKTIEKTYKTEKEIKEKLFIKGYDEKCIQKTIDFLIEYKFLDDVRFADMYIAEKLKAQGKNKIKYDLLRKGIPDEIVNQKIEMISEYEDDQEDSIVYELASKKYNTISKSESDSRKIYKKLSEFLVRKGYSWETTKKVVNKILKSDMDDYE